MMSFLIDLLIHIYMFNLVPKLIYVTNYFTIVDQCSFNIESFPQKTEPWHLQLFVAAAQKS